MDTQETSIEMSYFCMACGWYRPAPRWQPSMKGRDYRALMEAAGWRLLPDPHRSPNYAQTYSRVYCPACVAAGRGPAE